MSTVVVVLEDGSEVNFTDNTIGHQVGYGAVQIMLEDGTQYVYNNFKSVAVIPSEEEKAEFKEQQERAQAAAEAQIAAAEALREEMQEQKTTQLDS